MDYLILNPEIHVFDQRYKDFKSYALPYCMLYKKLPSRGRGSHKKKQRFRQNVLENFQKLTGIDGFQIRKEKRLKVVSSYEAGRSKICKILFNNLGRKEDPENDVVDPAYEGDTNRAFHPKGNTNISEEGDSMPVRDAMFEEDANESSQKRHRTRRAMLDCDESRIEPRHRIRHGHALQSFHLPWSNELRPFLSLCKQFVANLIKGKLGTAEGFNVVVEMPNGNNPCLNTLRNAPMRALFGLDKGISDKGFVLRYAYGSGSGTGSVGCDPRTFEVRLLDRELKEAAIIIKDLLKKYQRSRDLGYCLKDMSILDFTAVEIKLYAGKEIKGTGVSAMTIDNDVLGDHCDQVYSTDGEFKVKQNSQEPWTPVVIVSFGATRIVNFQLYDGKRKVGDPISIVMNDGDVFILVPADEYPSQYTFHKLKAGKWKHGVPKLQTPDHLSAAVIFRAVFKTIEVDTNNIKILSEHEENLMENVINTCQRAGYKKRSEHYDGHQSHLDDFLNNQKDKFHEQIMKAAEAVGIIGRGASG